MKKTPVSNSRRSFLKLGSAAATAPFILPSSIWAADTKPSDKITLGFVGMGTQNRGLLGGFIGRDNIHVAAVCDVDTTRREAAKTRVNEKYKNEDCASYNDFRELVARDDIDALVIATPDHWHAVITTAALSAGKDVYCEKPLTHNIFEAVSVMKSVEDHKRVLQTGSMQRSSSEFRIACELVQNGVIGKIERVECDFGDPGIPCDLPEEEMEKGLDWKMWLGPAEERPYNSELSPRGVHGHFPNWRTYREYGGGMVTDWGAHHLDIAQWGLGMDHSGPVEVLPPDEKDAKRGATLVYANGIKVIHKGGIGVHFFGSEGEVAVNRGKFMFKLGDKVISQFLSREDGGSLESKLVLAEREYLKDAKIKLYKSNDHLGDFLTCMGTRKKPITHEGVGAHTAICCHLMNNAYYHHQKFGWDPKNYAFTDGTGDPSWLTRDYKAGWEVKV